MTTPSDGYGRDDARSKNQHGSEFMLQDRGQHGLREKEVDRG